MTDFSPHAVKVAGQRVVDWFAAGEMDKFSQRSDGDFETTNFGCIIRITQMLDGEIVARVIDANGRHWFPDVAAPHTPPAGSPDQSAEASALVCGVQVPGTAPVIDQPAFTNALKSLFNIDTHDLAEFSIAQRANFIRDPARYFICAPDAHQDAIFREVAKRQRG